MNNFWQHISIPAFSLAPMEDVTDTVFREMVLGMAAPGKLHILFTEFTSVEGMNHPKGRKRVSERLVVNKSERFILKEKNVKLVAQIWGRNPELYYSTAKYLSDACSFDGIDINMGCPVKKVFKTGSCSALIGEPQLAREIISATKEGTHLPVSIKTRTGIKNHQTEEWIGHLLSCKPAAIILHGRTQRMQSEGEASWEEIGKAVQLKNQLKSAIPIHGNGDILTLADGMNKINETGVDGIMIGRGIFQNPWFFNPAKSEITKEERIQTLLEHTRLFQRTWEGIKNFNILKRFYKIYLNSFPEAAKLRAGLMDAQHYDDVYRYFENEYRHNPSRG